MEKVLILLAGYPATGKSTFCSLFLERHPGILVIAPDDIKEEVWDERGFDDAGEKERLELEVWHRYYARIGRLMRTGGPIITDYPFSSKQKPTLEQLAEEYGYRSVTVRFVGDLDRIYERSLARDLAPSRHLGHLMNRYHKGDCLEDRTKADYLVTPELLRWRCETKGYGSFQMGELIEVDATDISRVDWGALVERLEECVAREGS
ncbi:kinase [Coriobacteriales bacterium OH1046]|nr:kinase [Coriobacteriales bacterium OH1046]